MPKGVEHDNIAKSRTAYDSVESLMPKGVEHVAVQPRRDRSNRVESLMPKGVEHLLMMDTSSVGEKCRISDAERR